MSEYFPQNLVNDAVMPTAADRDLTFHQTLLEDKWRHHFPFLDYYPLLQGVTVQTANDGKAEGLVGTIPVGENGKTIVDGLWGEAVDPTMRTAPWEQPHLSSKYTVTGNMLYGDVLSIPFAIRREAEDLELKRWGFDRVRDILAITPLSFFDGFSVNSSPGDYLIWDDAEYEVLQAASSGWWKNTNKRTFMVLNCQQRRRGS